MIWITGWECQSKRLENFFISLVFCLFVFGFLFGFFFHCFLFVFFAKPKVGCHRFLSSDRNFLHFKYWITSLFIYFYLFIYKSLISGFDYFIYINTCSNLEPEKVTLISGYLISGSLISGLHCIYLFIPWIIFRSNLKFVKQK